MTLSRQISESLEKNKRGKPVKLAKKTPVIDFDTEEETTLPPGVYFTIDKDEEGRLIISDKDDNLFILKE